MKTFLIIAYNRPGHLKLCLESLYQLKGIEGWDVIVSIDKGDCYEDEMIKVSQQFDVDKILTKEENIGIALKHINFALKEVFSLGYEKICYIEEDHIFKYPKEVISYLEDSDSSIFMTYLFDAKIPNRYYYPRGVLIFKENFEVIWEYLVKKENLFSNPESADYVNERMAKGRKLKFPDKNYTFHFAPHNKQAPTALNSPTAQALIRHFPKRDGIYIDIGANHPYTASNSHIFYRLGWYGLCIEPIPKYYQMLKKDRSKDIIENCAISNYEGEDSFFINEGSINWGSSSLLKEWRCEQKRVKEIKVKVITLTKLLSKYPEIRDNCDFCSIDVEGAEKQVLEGIDFKKFSPKTFILESHGEHKEWEDILVKNNYKFIEVLYGNNAFEDRLYEKQT